VIAQAIYLLCALTSLACMLLLLGAHRANHSRLLFWSALCFLALAVNNLMLFVDVVMVPEVDLFGVTRNVVALGGVAALLYGLVWELR
jgi:hypothetical protein